MTATRTVVAAIRTGIRTGTATIAGVVATAVIGIGTGTLMVVTIVTAAIGVIGVVRPQVGEVVVTRQITITSVVEAILVVLHLEVAALPGAEGTTMLPPAVSQQHLPQVMLLDGEDLA